MAIFNQSPQYACMGRHMRILDDEVIEMDRPWDVSRRFPYRDVFHDKTVCIFHPCAIVFVLS